MPTVRHANSTVGDHVALSACKRWRRMVCRRSCRSNSCTTGWTHRLCNPAWAGGSEESERLHCTTALAEALPFVRESLELKFRSDSDVSIDPIMAELLKGLARVARAPLAADIFRPVAGAKDASLTRGLAHAAAARLPGLWLEFGAYVGRSTRLIASVAQPLGHTVHSFDSWRGLPESWEHLGKGAFNSWGSPPFTDPRIQWESGLFDETLPRFLRRYADNISFVHIDCDLYSSTATVLRLIENRISPGAVIVFDELINYKGYTRGELKALLESLRRTGRRAVPLTTPATVIKPDSIGLSKVRQALPDRLLQYIFPKNAAITLW